VEILGYHHQEREKRMLFFFSLENLKANNYLYVLHMGNTELEVEEPLLSLRHKDEDEDSEVSILESVYGEEFESVGTEGQLRQKQQRTAWDSSISIEDEEERMTFSPMVPDYKILYPIEDVAEERFIPFTAWCLGPFKEEGGVLVALRLTLRGDSYDKLVVDQPFFSVDGPELTLAKIRHSYIPFCLTEDKQEEAIKRLDSFGNYMNFRWGYDVIIVKPPKCRADEVIPLQKHSIVEAPIQPKPEGVGDRYITVNPWFKLALRYRLGMVREIIKANGKRDRRDFK
jgi:uncharacterized protein YrzB (UPF0473 family)